MKPCKNIIVILIV